MSLCEVNAAPHDLHGFFLVDRGSGLSAFINTSFKNQVKTLKKHHRNLHRFFHTFFIETPFRIIPKTLPKSIKKSFEKIDTIFKYFLIDFGIQNKSQNLPKFTENRKIPKKNDVCFATLWNPPRDSSKLTGFIAFGLLKRLRM